MDDLSKLMQVGDGQHWTELAACHGDDRFTQKNPPGLNEAKELSGICRRCDVFFECLEFHEQWGAIAVFAHGEWRHDNSIPAGDTVPASTDEHQRAAQGALPAAGESEKTGR